MLYGSLVGSRKHGYQEKKILERAARFQKLHKKFPKLPLYVFSSIMRTPRTSEASGHEDADYYASYGTDIFRYTLLRDKQEVESISYREKKEYAFLEKLIPREYLEDWMERREKNVKANQSLISLAKKNTFQYFLLGRDDNAPYSQTHMESRHLAKYSEGLEPTRYQSMAGVDEIGMLLLARAINTIQRTSPQVYVRYNWGRGSATIPAYSDEPIGQSIHSAIITAGGTHVDRPEGADLVLAVNTDPNGKTYEASDWLNVGGDRNGTKYFADIVAEYVGKGYPVGVADVAFANGSDNALMDQLKNRGLLMKLRAYAGWNTPTNSAGFAIGEGMLAAYMGKDSIERLLITRYLDDWAYQANIRGTVARHLTWLQGDGIYGSLDSKRESVMNRCTYLLSQFTRRNLPPLKDLEELEVTFPWNRMFETDILRGPARKGSMLSIGNHNATR